MIQLSSSRNRAAMRRPVAELGTVCIRIGWERTPSWVALSALARSPFGVAAGGPELLRLDGALAARDGSWVPAPRHGHRRSKQG